MFRYIYLPRHMSIEHVNILCFSSVWFRHLSNLRSVLRHTYQEGSNKLIIQEGDETKAQLLVV